MTRFLIMLCILTSCAVECAVEPDPVATIDQPGHTALPPGVTARCHGGGLGIGLDGVDVEVGVSCSRDDAPGTVDMHILVWIDGYDLIGDYRREVSCGETVSAFFAEGLTELHGYWVRLLVLGHAAGFNCTMGAVIP